jgi:hypothetical protein
MRTPFQYCLFAVLGLSGLWILSCHPDGDEPVKSKFITFIEEGRYSGQLETAIVTYENQAGCRVDLIAAVHLGDAEYYQSLQERFAEYDALLYEMIAPPDKRPGKDEKGDSLISLFQRALCGGMDLAFQLDALDYNRPNFVHADLTPGQFSRLWKEKDESIWKIILRVMMAQAKAMEEGKGSKLTFTNLLAALLSKDRAGRLKILLAREFENIEVLLAGLESGEEGEESVILGERNKAALAVLEEEIDKDQKVLGIFYGAGHMPDLELRLQRDLGFHKTGQEWLTAWRIEAGVK